MKKNEKRCCTTKIWVVAILLAISLLINCWLIYEKTKGPEPDMMSVPSNAVSSYSCDVRQGFNFEKDSQVLVGFINYLKIGNKELNSDFSVTDPEDVSKMIKVAGVLSGAHWQGGYADPILLSAQVSTNNKNNIATLLHKSMSNTEVEFEFTVYDYDPKVKAYYKAFHTNSQKLKGLIKKSAGELALNIEMDKSMEVVSPENYAFTIGIMPKEIDMEIHLAYSASDKLVKKFGVEVAK